MRPISVGLKLVAATATTVYTAPTGYYSKLTTLYLHNTGANNKHITVQWYDSSAGVSVDILTEVPYASKTYTQFSGGYVVLEEGDQLRAITEAASAFDLIATFEEIGLTRQ